MLPSLRSTIPFAIGSEEDIISLSNIIKDLIAALHKSRGSSNEYQDLICDLRLFYRTMLELEKLWRMYDDGWGLKALHTAAVQIASNCWIGVNIFLDKVHKYERSLQEEADGTLLRGTERKIQWHVLKKDEIVKFSSEICGQRLALKLLLGIATMNLDPPKSLFIQEPVASKAASPPYNSHIFAHRYLPPPPRSSSMFQKLCRAFRKALPIIGLFVLGIAILLVYTVKKHDLGTGTGLCALIWTAGAAARKVWKSRKEKSDQEQWGEGRERGHELHEMSGGLG